MKRTKRKLLPLEKAVIIAGGQAKLAHFLGVTQPTISYWINTCRGTPSTLEACNKIEELTNGLVRARDLNPKLFS